MHHYIVYSVILLAFSGFVEIQNGPVFAADDPLDDAPPSMSLAPIPGAAGSKRGHDEDEEQRKRARRVVGDVAAAADQEGEEGDDEEGEDGGEARAFAALSGEQVYANPIFDAAAKYLLADHDIRLGFMRTFTQNPHIVSTELLDSSLNPLRTFTQARAFLGDRRSDEFIERIGREREASRIKVTVGAEGEEEAVRNGGDFLVALSKIFGDLKKKFPPLERHSQLDVVCRLDNGEFILVEVQVKPQDFWDKRALCYAAAFYGNQLKRGGDWGDLKKVIAINLLGGEGRHWRHTPLELVRHYKFTSEVGGHRHEIDSLKLIQYNLLSPQIDGLTQVELKEWLQFWKAAHQRKADEVTGVTTAAVRSAYERVRVAALPEGVKAGYETEVADYLKYSQHIHHEKDEARKEGVEEGLEKGEHKAMLTVAIKMFKKGGAYTPDIMDLTGITEVQLREALAKEKGE